MEHLREGKALKVSNMSCAMQEIGMWDQHEQVGFELDMSLCLLFPITDTFAAFEGKTSLCSRLLPLPPL